jgi:hypothetical protein
MVPSLRALPPTAVNGNQQQIAANLDLSISTTHEQDQAAYCYPLQIK